MTLWQYHISFPPFRGVAEKGPNGDLKIKIPNYSYAEDGKLIWDAIHEFALGYLSIWYKDKDGERVSCLPSGSLHSGYNLQNILKSC